MTGKFLAVAVASFLTVMGLGLLQLRPAVLADTDPVGAQMDLPGAADQGIPSYHAYAPKPPLPATLDPKQFPDALNRNVYAMAAKIRPVLFQQPCYCYCDRHVGHKSLLDCYMSEHASGCDECRKEAILAYEQTRKGKTPAEIRAAIIRGDWKSVNLVRYSNAAPSL
jgi:Protein of unknown function with PCYCGC motif